MSKNACGSNSIKDGGAGDEVLRAQESKLKRCMHCRDHVQSLKRELSSKASGDTDGSGMPDQAVGTG